MKITLDRVALRHLMDSDPEFTLQLKSAVLSEVGRRFFEKDAARIFREASPALFDQAVRALQADADLHVMIDKALASQVIDRGSYSRPTTVTAEMQRAIDNAVTTAKTGAVTAAERVVRDTIATVVEERLAVLNLDDAIQKRIDRLTNEEIDRRVDAKVNERLAARRAALS